MKWIFLVIVIGFFMVKDSLAEQTDNILKINWVSPFLQETIEIPPASLSKRTNNWMSIQGGGDWEGLSEDQLHKRQMTFNTPEHGIRAGAISLITRALRKNNRPEVSINQIFFDEDGWAEDKESYRLDTISKGFRDTDTIDVMDRDQMKNIINFISNHEMGVDDYNMLKNKEKVINRGLDMAYEYVLSDNYSLTDLIK